MNWSIRGSMHNAALLNGRMIELGMRLYATDHNGPYPDGSSSTEVFQKLMDGNYITDPAVFYVPLPGKMKAIAGQKLKPENVCWDVTSVGDSSSSDSLPLVFLTGYRITYAPGGSALPIVKPYPPFWPERTWSEWSEGAPYRSLRSLGPPGIAVIYKHPYAIFKVLTIAPNGDASAANFVPVDFDPKGKTYRQLTPDGPLP